ncbi:MAG: hypothetical protein DMD79_20990 [Candidatus Rokuibacteriota bacterium]|nr:MAG: hypothetical protein DMD79_20990 [Candidatus Rokubacteria bacterium]
MFSIIRDLAALVESLAHILTWFRSLVRVQPPILVLVRRNRVGYDQELTTEFGCRALPVILDRRMGVRRATRSRAMASVRQGSNPPMRSLMFACVAAVVLLAAAPVLGYDALPIDKKVPLDLDPHGDPVVSDPPWTVAAFPESFGNCTMFRWKHDGQQAIVLYRETKEDSPAVFWMTVEGDTIIAWAGDFSACLGLQV